MEGTSREPREDAKSNPASAAKSEQDDQAAEVAKARDTELKQERRAKRKRRQENEQNWELLSRLSSLTADVEDVAYAATRLRHMWTTPRVLATDVELAESAKQQLANDHQNRLKEILFRQCGSALKLIMTNKWAYPFNTPVDTTRFKDYLNFVSQPMDFGSIKTKLDGGKYQHPDDMHADVKLVFDNARKYNPAGSDVYTMASSLEGKFEERWAASVTPKLGDEKLTRANQLMNAKKKILEQQQQQVVEQLERQRQQLLDRLHLLSTYVSDAKSQAAAACTALTQEEKSHLTRQLAHLPQEHFETALSLVLAHHPDLLPQGNSGDSVINPDHMDALTLRQLQSFIAAVHEGGAINGPAVLQAGEAGAGSEDGDRAVQQVLWPGLVLGTGTACTAAAATLPSSTDSSKPVGRKMVRQRRERGMEGFDRMLLHATSHNSLPHAGSGPMEGLQGEAMETSGGAMLPGVSQDAAQQMRPAHSTAPGSPAAPALSFAGQEQEQSQAAAGQLQDTLQGVAGPSADQDAEAEGTANVDVELNALLVVP